MAIWGDLGSIKLTDIFQMLYMTQQEQTLTVYAGDEKKTFHFASSEVSISFSGEKQAGFIGNILLNLGKITEEQLKESIKKQRDSDKRLGEVLCELGYVSQEDVNSVIQRQIEEEIYDLLAWEKGYFEIQEGPPEQDDISAEDTTIQLTFKITDLLMEAVRRIDEWQTMRQLIPSDLDVAIWVDSNKRVTPDHEILPYEDKLYQLINGKRTIRRLIEILKLPKFDIFSVFRDLLEKERVRLLSPEELRGLAKKLLNSGEIDDGLRVCERVIELKPENLVLRERLAKIYTKLDKTRDAARHYTEIATFLYNEGKSKKAIKGLERALKLDRNNVDARETLFKVAIAEHNLGKVYKSGIWLINHYIHLGYLEKAKTICKKIIQTFPDDVNARLQLIDILLIARDVKGAIRECEILENKIGTKNPARLREIYEKVLLIDKNRSDIALKLSKLKKRPRKKKDIKKIVKIAVIIIVLLAAGALLTMGILYPEILFRFFDWILKLFKF